MAGRTLSRVVVLLALGSAIAMLCCAGALGTPAAGVAWTISRVAQPTNFMLTAGGSSEPVDQYVLMLTNTGKAPSSGPIVVTDKLPAGVTVANQVNSPGWESCTEGGGGTVITCTYAGVVSALGQSPVLAITVAVAGPAHRTLTNSVTVSGGGAPVATASNATEVDSSAPPFGFVDFGVETTSVSGLSDTQAGDHPYAFTTLMDFPQQALKESPREPGQPVQIPRAMEIELPAGLIGNPQAAPRCTIIALFAHGCPLSSRVGTFFVNLGQRLFVGVKTSPIYNIVPEHGYPAEFGLYIEGIEKVAFLYASVGPPPAYRLHVSVPSIPAAASTTNVIVTFFGDPQGMDNPPGQEVNSPIAFFTNPSDCSGAPLVTKIKVNTYEEPEHWVEDEATEPAVAGCNLLQFQPSLSLTPETSLADEPSGYSVDLQVPQSQSAGLEGLATPDVKDTTVTLPPGVSISPAAADGLVACPAEGPEGIDLAQAASGHCPLASQVGTAEAVTPLLAEPLHGHLYVAQPGCGGAGQGSCGDTDALDGNLYGLYLQLEGSGVTIKLRGTVSANPATGQLTTTFREAPQQPVSDLKLMLSGGPRAPLANPQTCGEAITSADIAPWSAPETPDATPSFAFNVTGCEGSPFAPSFLAGTTSTNAGAYTSFSTTFGRTDRQQDLAGVQVQTPQGLLGMLSHVTLCGEPQAAQGACPVSSRIGTATAGAGAGSHPFWESGPVYLTGPYKGAPFGLSVAIPAVAGPFNLGTIVVRAAINIDPNTATLTVTSDPLPQIVDGVPLRVQTVNVTVDKPQFMFNPTNCNAEQITAKIASTQAAVAQVSSPFAAGGCKNLPFKPSFKASTQARTSKAQGASLTVKVTSTAGQANIARVDLQLPRQLPARLTTLQKACTEAQFAANPAGCPAASVIGVAKAITPVLNVPLIGPAYLVSHGGAAFPDVEFILQGQGVRIDLDGKTQIKKGITYSRFETVPDAPISSFETVLPQGPHSVLATDLPVKAKGSLCGSKLTIPTTLTGQNGAVVKQSTRIAVTSCPKARKAKKHKQKAKPKK